MNAASRTRAAKVVQYALLTLGALMIVFPILYALGLSLMSGGEAAAYPPHIIPQHFQLKNFVSAVSEAPLGRFMLNSFIVSVIVTLAQLVTASLAAYAFAFMEFPFKKIIFLVFLSTMMIPGESTLIPNYLTIRSWHWINTYQGLTVPFMATAFGTFLLRQFFLTLPHDLFDAARIDGCGRLRFLWSIALPMARPALGTLGVYAFINTWNQYLWPLLITNSTSMRTVQIGIGMLQFQDATTWNVVMAGVVIILLPSLLTLVLGQKQLVKGLTSGAVKG
ncbi:Binding-protein-dependent transport system inner membrane component [Acididesulfobacillus acetoxydans]|uniref:Binding-protein-dependent transport system inner membrane component n=1 Tax=Acididesulfobacillus acetoxydans TaxID=1561005 RepID=A0A8S0XB19_9FIRM|nr:carbohydrate ABC transporter permease [Acididesulfobacillus acetoxydans]CAA7600656.1 Binding-protein-dependent transport system inner membrane component [Acididesulfobacillus acetoxydans]CEJ09437.1 sn-glycerol-3-phosphate transport system permease protein UgpE [Acididesulfobacillus acetoxydans]